MKKISIYLLSLIAIGVTACSDDFLEKRGFGDDSVQKIIVTVDELTPQNETRTVLSKDENNKTVFVWSETDEIGIFPDQGYQTGFSMANGAGAGSAEFTGGGWGLKASSTYAAYYPLIHDTDLDKTAIPLDYTGQKQTENGSSAHLSAYDFMSAPASVPESGMVAFRFGHLGALLHFKLTVPEDGIYTSLIVKTNGSFPVKSSLNLKTNELTPVAQTSAIELSLDSLSISANEELDAYMFIPAVDLSENTLTASLLDINDAGFTVDLGGKNFEAGDVWNFTRGSAELEIRIPYLTFTAPAEQTLTLSKAVETLEYSVNDGEWLPLGTNTVTFGGQNGDLRLRGKSSWGTATTRREGSASGTYSTVRFGWNSNNTYDTPVECSGDIRTLIDYENYKTCDTSNARFCELFTQARQLTRAPKLPALDLASDCYYDMFYGCTGLTQAPKLPATTLAERCYGYMFNGCTSLTQPPVISAATLAQGCCRFMFAWCTGLTHAPTLPATTLASDCYDRMFVGCTGLIQAPELPATTLVDRCYNQMFYDCTGLTKAPVLPATSLAESCYYGMFNGCTSLSQAPNLPATTLDVGCYNSMFSGCTSLTKAPALPATTLAYSCYNGMFSGTNVLPDVSNINFNVETAPTGWQGLFAGTKITDNDLKRILPLNQEGRPYLPPTTLTNGCYSSMFADCVNLTQSPALPATTLAPYCYNGMFSGTNVLPDLSNVNFNVETAPQSWAGLFSGTNVTYDDLKRILPLNQDGKPYLPPTILTEGCYSSMFADCKRLTQGPELPAMTLANNCYFLMFHNCTNLTTAPDLPATTLANSCYSYMFLNCTALTQAPELPAPTLTNYCYSYMFAACTNLRYIKMMATDISADGCLSAWASWASSSGTFVKNAAATWSNENVVPSGWRVQTATN